MKHLKRFNEAHEIRIDKLIYEYLAYLKDAGFNFNFYTMGVYFTSFNVIKIEKNKSGFYWDDIKYDLLPFLEVLTKSYEVKNILLYGNFSDTYEVYTDYISFGQNATYSITDIINDKGIPSCELTTIEILFV